MKCKYSKFALTAVTAMAGHAMMRAHTEDNVAVVSELGAQVTLNNASDYWTNWLYRTHITDPSPFVR